MLRICKMEKVPELNYQSFLADAMREYLDYLDHLGFSIVDPAYNLRRIDRFLAFLRILVGEEFQVTIVLGKQTPLDSVLTDFSEVLDLKTMEDKLELMTRTALSATFRAEKPGQTHIDVPVMDRKTLLSPPLRVTIDVLPAR